jgi:hypothetical protein
VNASTEEIVLQVEFTCCCGRKERERRGKRLAQFIRSYQTDC